MWAIITSEIKYVTNRTLLFLVLALPFLLFLQMRYESLNSFWVIWLIFLISQNWNTYRNKEKHEYRNRLLPLSSFP